MKVWGGLCLGRPLFIGGALDAARRFNVGTVHVHVHWLAVGPEGRGWLGMHNCFKC